MVELVPISLIGARYDDVLGNPRGDKDGRDPHTEAIKRERRTGFSLVRGSNKRGVVGRAVRRYHMIIDSAVLVVDNQKRRALPKLLVVKNRVVHIIDENFAVLHVVIWVLV